uniref:Uncharacterized protein n=1 Tax=Knipowitschia caucasica TaxID=637954 RepID=A0AAV2MQH9_KNICA
MVYLAHSAQAQLGALPLGLVGCSLLAVSLGLVQWRVWLIPQHPSVSSGIAWIASGILGFAALLYALRNAFFGIKKRTRFAFRSGGVLTLLAAILSLIPLLWNAVVVLHGGSINFPPDFKLPPTPEEQQVGGAVWVGLVGVALLVVTAIINFSYKLPEDGARWERRGKDNAAFQFDDVRI